MLSNKVDLFLINYMQCYSKEFSYQFIIHMLLSVIAFNIKLFSTFNQYAISILSYSPPTILPNRQFYTVTTNVDYIYDTNFLVVSRKYSYTLNAQDVYAS